MRKALILATALFFGGAAAAQEPVQAPANFTLTLTGPEVTTVGAALAKMPYEQVNALLAKLQAQVNTQVAPPSQPTSAADKDKTAREEATKK